MKILFQGDSITDAGRSREDLTNLGAGYPLYAAKYIKEAYPCVDFEFVNRGISGNQTKDLVARLQEDFIDIQPDIVSVMIGINDVWHHADDRSWISDELFESNLRTIYTAIREKTDAKIMIIEPFLIPVEDKMFFWEDLCPKILTIRRIAREFADVYLPTDGLLNEAFIGHDPLEFSADGVHPTAFGADFIGRKYADAVSPLIEDLKK